MRIGRFSRGYYVGIAIGITMGMAFSQEQYHLFLPIVVGGLVLNILARTL